MSPPRSPRTVGEGPRSAARKGTERERAAPGRGAPKTAARPEVYELRLYVAGMTPRSRRAIANLKEICEEFLQGRYDLEVIDVFQRPALTREEQIFATPTLVKRLPAPLQRFIGDLSQREKVLVGLDLQKRARR